MGVFAIAVARCRAIPVILVLAAQFGVASAQQAPIRPVVPTPGELAPKEGPPPTEPSQLPKRPAPPRELGKPQEELTLDVTRYEVSDNAPPELKAALPALTAPYVGPKRHYEDLVNAAAEVTRFLQRDSGYYLGYAYIPEQEPHDGVVRIQVLEGRLDRVELVWRDDLPVKREVIEAYLKALKPGEILRVRDLERVVFLVNDLRGINARFEVTAGSVPGTASLVVTPQPEERYSGRVEINDYGAPYLGQGQVGALAYANSLFGLGDSLTANLLVSRGLQFVLFGTNVPVGANGLKFGATLSATHYKLDESQFPLGVNGGATSISAYGLYPWVRSRNLNLFLVGTVDSNNYVDRQDVAGVEVRKSIRRVVLGLTGDLRDSLLTGAVNSFDTALAHGRVSYADGAPGGLDDAPDFNKLVLGVNRLQNVVEGRLLLYLALRAQHAFANLDVNEQFRIGGPDAVRAFAPGEGTADSGEVATIELRLLPPESLVGRAAREMVGSVFYDAGWVTFRHDPSQRPAGFVNTASYGGAGLALAWEHGRQFTLRASLAKPLHGEPTSDKPRSVRFYLQLTRPF
jgi:hemolysin activation/secretion protein